jgi:hypothetical protein
MKLSDLMNVLSDYDPSSEVLIGGKQSYLDFKVVVHEGKSVSDERLPIIAIEPTEERSFITYIPDNI